MSNTIELKALKFGVAPTILGQIHKIEEEEIEFASAILKNDYANAIEEFYDSIQAKITAMRRIGIPMEQIIGGQAAHYCKLENRGWKFEE